MAEIGAQEYIDLIVNYALNPASSQKAAQDLKEVFQDQEISFNADNLRLVKEILEKYRNIDVDAQDFKKGGKDATKRGDKDLADQEQKRLKAIQAIGTATNAAAGLLTTLTKGSLNLLEEIYNKLKSASPLLQAIESLFNLAMTLFFMPLGNKLGEVLIPAVIELVEKVVELWDSFEGMTLGEIFTYAIVEGIALLAEFFTNLGNILINTGDKTLASVGGLLKSIANFLTTHAVSIFNKILGFVTWIVDHLGELIGLIILFKTIHVALMLAQIAATLTSGSLLQYLTFGAAGIVAAVGIGASLSAPLMFAEGGHVPATPGGQLAVIGEGGEGEWVIPDSKMDSIGSKTYNTFNIQCWNPEEVASIVDDRISRQVSGARLRGSF